MSLVNTYWHFNDSVNWLNCPYQESSVSDVTVYAFRLSFETMDGTSYGTVSWMTYYGFVLMSTMFDGNSVYGANGWNDSFYQDIHIIGGDYATNAQFESWLRNNATQITPSFTVTFNANGHGTAPSPQTVQQGGRATKPTDPTASGYRFDGWYTEQTCVNLFNFNTTINADRTLYAKWTRIRTVSFNMNGHGTQISSQSVANGEKATRPTDPTATGYIFGGWYTERACTNLFDFNTAITSNKTLYAKWTQTTPTYTVTFNANGHGTAPSSQTIEEGQKATRPTDPTASGYRFDGWFTEQACINEFDFNTPITANRTLWAKWTAAYNVTFNMHGHGTQVPQQAVVSGDTAERPPDPSADGYRFDGWYTESTYTNLFDFDTPITSNITLHAKWTQVITYSVTYSTQFGSVPTKYKEQGTTLTSDDLPLLEHEGYRFGGWYLDETYHTPALGKEMTENITVYAKWTEITAQLPLYIGNNLITKIFIGADEISSIYIGEDRVF